MEKSRTQRFKVLALLALPIIAIVMALMVFSLGHSNTGTAEASGPSQSLEVSGGGTVCLDGSGAPTTNVKEMEKCIAGFIPGLEKSTEFQLTIWANNVPAISGYAAEILPGALTYNAESCANTNLMTRNGGADPASCPAPFVGPQGQIRLAAGTDPGPNPAADNTPGTIPLARINLHCSDTGTVKVTATRFDESAFGGKFKAETSGDDVLIDDAKAEAPNGFVADTILVNCLALQSTAASCVNSLEDPTPRECKYDFVDEEGVPTTVTIGGLVAYASDDDEDGIAGYHEATITVAFPAELNPDPESTTKGFTGGAGIVICGPDEFEDAASQTPSPPLLGFTTGSSSTCAVDQTPDSGGFIDTYTGATLFAIDLNCNAVGTFVFTVTALILDEDKNEVPATTEQSSVDVAVTCNPVNPRFLKVDQGPGSLGLPESIKGGTTEDLLILCDTFSIDCTDAEGNDLDRDGILQALCEANEAPFTRGSDCPGDSLANIFLTRQGDKMAPVRCQDSTDVSTFREVLHREVIAFDPKAVDPVTGKPVADPPRVDVGAYEFEVRYDAKLVCIELVPGTAAATMTCFIKDDFTDPPTEGISRMACVTKGKGASPPNTAFEVGRHLATIIVRPQPELYTQILPNQDNGIHVPILNQDCELADVQGHPIKHQSCEDAQVTIRWLEGDVVADCIIDAIDQQAVAFRWGAQKGNLLYHVRYDNEPSGIVAGGGNGPDGDIDIKDLQFVFGRHASSCNDPHPLQAPVNK